MSKRNIQAYTEKTVIKALCWLEQQPNDWSHQIKDVNTVVQLYLQSQENKEEDKDTKFTKELKKFCNKEDLENKDTLPLANPLPSSQKSASFQELDLKSQNTLQQAVEEFNLSSQEEALKLLIQIGYKSLQSLSK